MRRFLEEFRDRMLTTRPVLYLADASSLWVAEQTGITDILTIDLRDFSAHRLRTGKALVPAL